MIIYKLVLVSFHVATDIERLTLLPYVMSDAALKDFFFLIMMFNFVSYRLKCLFFFVLNDFILVVILL